MFTIEAVSNLVWCDTTHECFTCDVKYAEFQDIHPSAIRENDSAEHIRTIWANGISGEYGPISEYLEPIVIATKPQPNVQGAQTL